MSNVNVYRGIRFARAERFRPPERLPPGKMVPGGQFGPPAPQNPDPLDSMWGEVLAPGDEDCLTLNIWTPAADNRRRPVMVWVHGGAFLIGSGRWGWYEGCRLVERGDVVLVTLNYRLGAFGFLDLSEIGGSGFEASANLGLLDQVAALEWVRDNIERFGGDPTQVTLFGESAGSMSVCCLLAMERARGLFHRAIAQSGGANLVRSRDFSRRAAQAFLKHAGVPRIEGLRSLSMQDMLAAQESLLHDHALGGELRVFGPVVDGPVLPTFPLHAIRAGSAKDVPLLTGTTRDEMQLWSLYDPNYGMLSHEAWERWLERIAGPPLAALRAAYAVNRPHASVQDVNLAILGDALFRMPLIRLAEAQAHHRSDTRMYLFAWNTPVHEGRLGAPHAVELPFVFGNLGASGVHELIGNDAEREGERQRLVEAVQGAWIAFARTGDPNHPGLPAWPAYDQENLPTLVFCASNALATDPLAAERLVWERVPFDSVLPAIEDLPV